MHMNRPKLIVSDSFLNFLMQSKKGTIENFIYRALYHGWQGHKADRFMITTEYINYLTLRDDGTISYLPAGKEHVTTENRTWSRKNRQNGAPSRVIRKLLTPNAQKLFKDSDYEAFANSYKSACDAECKTFEIWENKRIPEAYCMDREEGGTLGDSCMNGDRSYLSIYKHCPHVRILVLINNCGDLAGRALLWNIDDGKTLMDRVYVAKDYYYDMFLDYAEKNDYVRKVEYKSFREKDRFVYKGETFYRQYKIYTSTDYSYYPYIDTFSYGDDGFITNCSGYQYEYTCTNGEREGEDSYICAISGDRLHEDDAVYIEHGQFRGEYIHVDYTVYCVTDDERYYSDDTRLVKVGDSYYRKDDDDIVEVDGDYHHVDDVVWSEFHGEYLLCDDAIFSEHHESDIRRDEAVTTPDGKVWHKDDITEC